MKLNSVFGSAYCATDFSSVSIVDPRNVNSGHIEGFTPFERAFFFVSPIVVRRITSFNGDWMKT